MGVDNGFCWAGGDWVEVGIWMGAHGDVDWWLCGVAIDVVRDSEIVLPLRRRRSYELDIFECFAITNRHVYQFALT